MFWTVGIVDFLKDRFEKLSTNLEKAGLRVSYTLQNQKLSTEDLSGFKADVLFVHINDVMPVLRKDMSVVPSRLVLKYSGGRFRLGQGELSGSKVFKINRPIDQEGTGVLTVDECRQIAEYLEGTRRILTFVDSVDDSNDPFTIIAPFILLHFGLQMEQESTEYIVGQMSEEEKIACGKGSELLQEEGKTLKEEFKKLVGIGGSIAGVTSPERDLEEFVARYCRPLYQAFRGAVSKGFYRLEGKSADEVLMGIETFRKILGRGVAWRKSRELRHHLQNLVPRLTDYEKPISIDEREELKREMGDLLPKVEVYSISAVRDYFGIDPGTEVETALTIARSLKESVIVGSDDSEILLLRDRLITCLEQIIDLTNQIAPPVRGYQSA